MILDSDDQKKALLHIIDGTSFKGQAIDFIYALKQDIIRATVKPRAEQKENSNPRK